MDAIRWAMAMPIGRLLSNRPTPGSYLLHRKSREGQLLLLGCAPEIVEKPAMAVATHGLEGLDAEASQQRE